MLKVSICIPTYNQSQFIAQCIDSALAQTWPNLEVVVAVNHCTDDTEAVLAQYTDPRLRVVKPPRFLGMHENFNFCVQASEGEVFCLLPSDDALIATMAEEHATVMSQNPDVAFSHSAVEFMDENGVTTHQERSVHGNFIRKGITELPRYLLCSRANLPSVMFRRSAFDAVGGFRPLKNNMDWDLYLHLLQLGDVSYRENVLCRNRSWLDAGGERKSRTVVQIEEIAEMYRTHGEVLIKRYPHIRAHISAGRRFQAQAFIPAYSTADAALQAQIRAALLELSSDWRTRLTLRLCDSGLGTLFVWQRSLDTWARRNIKRLLRRAFASS